MNADRLLALYDRVVDAPDAIPRLRRFVLDLAVRGKLVEQDSAEEPAEELIELTAKGGAQVDDQLPASWRRTTLGRVIELRYGKALKASERLSNGPVPVFGSNGVVGHTGESLTDCPAIIVGRKGSAGALNVCNGPSWTTDVAYFVMPPSYLDLHFLHLSLRTLDLDALGKGVKPGLSRADAYQRSFHAPPLAEQHRIVAKVDELMALLDQLEAARMAAEDRRVRLSRASLARLTVPEASPEAFPEYARFALGVLPAFTSRADQIPELRQAILNLAVRGKLVEQDPEDEPAGVLLGRLALAREAAFSAEGLRKRAPVSRIGREEFYFQFPESWAMPSFDDAFVIVSGVTKGGKVPAESAVELPYLRVANVQRGYLDLSVVKQIVVSYTNQHRYRLKGGDVLMTEGGDWDKLGRAAVWNDEVPDCIHQNHIFRVRPPSADILPEWVTLYVNSELGRHFFENASKQTTNLASINMTQLRSCPLPLPPLAEQRRIVAKVHAFMTLCDQLESALADADTTKQRLLEALLYDALEEPVGRREAA